MTTDYKVGYGRPPQAHRFRPGRSGNSRGRPKKQKDPAQFSGEDMRRMLEAPVTVKEKNGTVKEMTLFEIRVRRLVDRGIRGKEFKSIITFLIFCEQHGVISPAETAREGGVLRPPRGVDDQDWLEKFFTYGEEKDWPKGVKAKPAKPIHRRRNGGPYS